MKNLFFFFLAGVLIFAFACTGRQKQSGDDAGKKSAETTADAAEEAGINELTEQEESDGWMLLFNGESADGWRGVNKDDFPTGWKIVDGTLHCAGSGMGEAGAEDGGDILYDEKFSDFHLKLEWKVEEGGNSGIFYLGEEREDWPIWRTAPEMQILDNERHLDANLGKDGNRQAGSLYDLIPAKPQNAKPAGEWNSAEVMVYRGTVVHKQNGEVVLEYHLWTDDWNNLVKGSKFPELNPDWANVPKEGYIALQDHGDDVWFRNIKLKKL
jgi:hypothetical protein